MRPRNDILVQVIREGREEVTRVALANKLDDYEDLRKFTNRMIMRLKWAEDRITELEAGE